MTFLFEKKILTELINNDGLTIFPRGFCESRILKLFFDVYSVKNTLILFVNGTDNEYQVYIKHINKKAKVKSYNVKDIKVSDRISLYNEGGIFFTSSQICILDMLTDRLPIAMITGIDGFLKAISSHQDYFNNYDVNIEIMMKSMYLPNFFIWPRFQADIVAELNECDISMIQMKCKLTDKMTNIHQAILLLVRKTITDLRKGNKIYDILSVEKIIIRKLGQIKKSICTSHMDLTPKQLLDDLENLIRILNLLTSANPLEFYSSYNSIRFSLILNIKNGSNTSSWFYTVAADTILKYEFAKLRLFNCKNSLESINQDNVNAKTMEMPPKWKLFNKVIEDIQSCNPAVEENGMVKDDAIIPSIKEIEIGNETEIIDNVEKMKENIDLVDCSLPMKKIRKIVKNQQDVNIIVVISQWSLLSSIRKIIQYGVDHLVDFAIRSYFSTVDDEELIDNCELLLPATYVLYKKENINYICFVCNETNWDYQLNYSLEQIKPQYVILYQPELYILRQLEIFKASREDVKFPVIYNLMYSNSIEEQYYLSSVMNEKRNFTNLIKLKHSLPTVIDVETNFVKNTRNNENKNIVIDIREFKSLMPSLLYANGFNLLPYTIEIGDYILSDKICVERKSIEDLRSSLANGRLYSQCESILRYVWSRSPKMSSNIFSMLKKTENEPDVEKILSRKFHSQGQYDQFQMDPNLKMLLLRFPGISTKNVQKIMEKFTNLRDICNSPKNEIKRSFSNVTDSELIFKFMNNEYVNKEIKQ
ncbi:DNA repair protein rad16 [Intoshia linei]|uniref:DNA repair protein rad16 n=1 Tax=Intoshia linei TaxID=1819745 RepID=A0A177B0A2_9BILA|nr:DNA repair protein rad16 [Intoshia linei]